MLKLTLTTKQAANILMDDTYANWSYDGAHALAEYLEQLSADIGEDMDLDRVAIRCQFSEYDSLSDLLTDYPDEDEETILDRVVATDNESYWIVDAEM